MHERALLADLVRELEAVAAREGATAVRSVHLRLGPLSHLTPAHLREHFADATRGTIAEGARCEVEQLDAHDPLAQSVVLERVELELP